MTSLDQGDPYGIGYIKTEKIELDKIQCERGFLYILGDPGPLCAMDSPKNVLFAVKS